MPVNPYESHRSDDDTPRSRPRILLGIGASILAFAVGLAWIKLQRLTPGDVNPTLYVIAELVAYSGVLAAVGLGVRAGLSSLVARLGPSSASSPEAALLGWNVMPATFTVLIGAGWCALGLLGLYSLLIDMTKWDFYTGLPVRELVFQIVLYGSGVAAGVCCLIAGRNWMRTTYHRALLYTAIGAFGPVVAYVILFRVCDKLIRYLI